MGALIGIVMEAIRIRQRWKRLPKYVQFVRDYLISIGWNQNPPCSFSPTRCYRENNRKIYWSSSEAYTELNWRKNI